MTDPVQEARATAKAVIAHWQETRRGVNDSDLVPARLDQIVSVADRAITKISQDIVTDVDAIVAELSILHFPVEDDHRPHGLQGATLMLVGALNKISVVATRAGFSQEDDLQIPLSLRIPLAEIAGQAEMLAKAIEAVRPAIEEVAETQTRDGEASPKQAALVSNLMDRASLKIDMIGIKTMAVQSLDVSGVVALARQLTNLLEAFVALVLDAASHLSLWLARAAQGRIRPKIGPITEGSLQLVRRAMAWVGSHASKVNDSQQPLQMIVEGLGSARSSAIDANKSISAQVEGMAVTATQMLTEMRIETWVFATLDQLDDALRKVNGDRAILVLHDIDVPPSNPLSTRVAIEKKIDAFHKRVDELFTRLDRKVDLFVVVCLFLNQQQIPFVKYPERKYFLVTFLPFLEARNVRGSFEPNPDAIQIVQSHFRNWIGSPSNGET